MKKKTQNLVKDAQGLIRLFSFAGLFFLRFTDFLFAFTLAQFVFMELWPALHPLLHQQRLAPASCSHSHRGKENLFLLRILLLCVMLLMVMMPLLPCRFS